MDSQMSIVQPYGRFYQGVFDNPLWSGHIGLSEPNLNDEKDINFASPTTKRVSLVLKNPYDADSYDYYTSTNPPPPPKPSPTTTYQFNITRKPVPGRTPTTISDETSFSSLSSSSQSPPTSPSFYPPYHQPPSSPSYPSSSSSTHTCHLTPLRDGPETTVPLRCIGSTQALVDCPICQCCVLTRAKRQSVWSRGGRRAAGFLFQKSQDRDVVHYCGVCRSALARWSSDGNVEILV